MKDHTNIHGGNSSIVYFMPVDNVTACQSWSYCTLSNGHFHFWPKKGAPDLFRTQMCVVPHPGPMSNLKICPFFQTHGKAKFTHFLLYSITNTTPSKKNPLVVCDDTKWPIPEHRSPTNLLFSSFEIQNYHQCIQKWAVL